MSIETAPACALGLSHETLSALRDGLLPAAEQERVRTHIATCAACQALLTDFDMIAAELRGQRVPTLDERLWRGLQAAITNSPRVNLPLSNKRTLPLPSKQIWGALGAAAAILLVVAGFARLLYAPPVNEPKNPLVWHEIALPAPLLPSGADALIAPGALASIGLGPGGQTAYACSIKPNVTSQVSWIWVTRDSGATWQHATKFALFNGTPTTCAILVDATDPSVTIATFTSSTGQTEAYVTLDRGANWSQLASGQDFARLATRQGLTYALRADATAADTSARLAITYDQFQSWTPMDGDLVASGEHVTAFWLAPASNEVLAATDKGHLWQSESGDGKRWVELTTPAPAAFTARPLADGRTMRICGLPLGQSAGASSFCSTDGGQTWATLPALDHAPSCTLACAQLGQFILGIGSDDALLERTTPIGDTANTGRNDIVYRLAPGARQWGSLGAIPGGGVADDAIFAPGLAANTVDSLWAFSLGIRPSDGQGLAGPGAHLYAAAYPPNAPIPAPSPTVAPTPTVTPAPAPPYTFPTAWRTPSGGPANVAGFAFAPSAPQIGYACTGISSGPQPTPTPATGGPALEVTHDGGATWQALRSGPFAQGHGCGVPFVDDSDANDIFVATEGPFAPNPNTIISELWRSRNGGASWAKLASPYPNDPLGLMNLTVVGGRIIVDVEYDGAGMLPYYIIGSDDGGATWTPVGQSLLTQRTSGVPDFAIDLLVAAGPTLYANLGQNCRGGCREVTPAPGQAPPGEYRSTDRGDSWHPVSVPGYLRGFTRTPSGAYYGLAQQNSSGSNGPGATMLYWSRDAGATWTALPTMAGLEGGYIDPASLGDGGLTIAPDSTVIAGTLDNNPHKPAGLFYLRAADPAPTWRPLAPPGLGLQAVATSSGIRLWGIQSSASLGQHLVYVDLP